MALTGYRNRCAKNSGGIESIRLIETGKIVEADYDPATDSYRSFSLAAGAEFAYYQFREEQAVYRETLSLRSGSPQVFHELLFALDGLDGNARRAIEQLTEASIDGMVAIVTTNSRESLVVGYSEEFLDECPLRLKDVAALSGAKTSDRSMQTISLYSLDIRKARSYSGQ